MRAFNPLIHLLILGVLLLPSHCFALRSDRDQPLHLEADSVEIDDATGISVYMGNVIITQGSLKIWAEKMWIHRRSGKTEKIVTIGNPTRFRQLMDDSPEEVRGRSKRAELYPEKDELLLIDEAVVEQGKDQFRSDRIIFQRDKSLVKAGASAQGKERVHVIIEPADADK